jgi:hypothetical protein
MVRFASKVLSDIKKFGKKATKTLKRFGSKASDTLFGKSLSRLPSKAKWTAKFARDVYNPKESRKSWGSLKYVEGASTDKVGIWTNDSKKEAVVAFRGTDIKDPTDLGEDALIGLGLEGINPRVKIGVNIIRNLIDEGYTRVYVTGHSLGGSIGITVLSRLSTDELKYVEVFVFNPGVMKTGMTLIHPNFAKALRIYHTSGDPISVLARTVDAKVNKTYKPKMANVHSIDNFV